MARQGHTRRTVVASASAIAWAGAAAGCASVALGGPRPIALEDLVLVADGLDRPEGVVVTRDGRVIVLLPLLHAQS